MGKPIWKWLHDSLRVGLIFIEVMFGMALIKASKGENAETEAG